jgi:hypothetical protein
VTLPPLLYLTLRSLRNQIRARLRRLRQPRYLIASVFGLAYFWFLFLGQAFRRRRPRQTPTMFPQARMGLELVGSLFLLVIATLAWIMPASKRPALAFTRSEVQYLFTAPISRRRLVRYRVLRSQLGALFGSIIITVVFRPGSLGGGFATFFGIAIIMAILSLYSTAVSLTRASLGPRRAVPRAMAVAALLVVAGTVTSHWNEISTAFLGGKFEDINRIMTSGASGVVLWPFRALMQLPLAQTPRAFLVALPWPLLVIALIYVWVLRTDVPFEEASAELSEKIADVRKRGLSALRKPRKTAQTPFNLPAIGRPETAIVWKNLISMGRLMSWTMLIRVVPLIMMFAAAFSSRRRGNGSGVLAIACLFVAAFTVILGPQMVRRDLRQDLNALAILKTWPIRGAALVRGEILAPAIALTVIASIALAAAAVLSANAPFVEDLPSRWSLLVAALCIAPGIVLAQLVAQNGLAVTFPSWVSLDPRPGGVDAVGQGLLVMLAVLLALVAAVVPAALVAGVVAGVLYLLLGTVPVILPGVLAGAALLVEAFIGTEVIGAILERSDISAVDARET